MKSWFTDAKTFWLGFVIAIGGGGIPILFPSDSTGIFGLICMIIGITLIFSHSVFEGQLEAKGAKVRDGFGLFGLVLGCATIGFIFFMMISVGVTSFDFLRYDAGYLIFLLMWVILIGIYLSGLFLVLNYFNGRKYEKWLEMMRENAVVHHDWKYSIPPKTLLRFRIYNFGLSYQNTSAMILKSEKFFPYKVIKKIWFYKLPSNKKEFSDFIGVSVGKKGVKTMDFILLPAEKINELTQIVRANNIKVYKKDIFN